MRGAVALDASIGRVDGQNFDAYVRSLKLESDFPGVRVLGAIERVARKGAPDAFHVKFASPHLDQPIVAAHDLATDPVLLKAIEQTIESGEPALTGLLTVMQDGQPTAGFLYLIPVFDQANAPDTPQARRASLKVIYYAQINAQEMLNQIQYAAGRSADYEIFDGSSANAENLIYMSQKPLAELPIKEAPANFSAQRKYAKNANVMIGGHVFTIRTGSTSYFDAMENGDDTKEIIFITGVVLSVLMSAIVWLLLSWRARLDATVRRMTAELQNSLNENRDLMQALDQNLSVSITDSAGNIIFANDFFSKLTGFTNEELIGNNHRLIRSDVQPDAFWEEMWRTISGGAVWRSEVCNRSKSGGLYWVNIVIVPIFNGDEIEKYVSIRIDISAARAAQDALTQERQNLQNIIMGTGAGTWELDVQSGMLTCNERWAAMLGYTLEELQPISMDTWARICHPDDLDMSVQKISDYFAGLTDALDAQIRVIHKDGHVGWIRTLAKISARDVEGNPVRLSGTNMDISTEKEYENSLQSAMQVAQAATVAKSQFLANMSHELRTPMNAILGMLRLLKNTELNQRQKDYALKTEGAAKSLLGLLNDILDISKIDAGKMELDPQPFRTDYLLRDLSVILSSGVKDKQVEVLFDLDKRMPSALIGDAMRLKQILINLGGNATKFTVQGSVVLQIRVQERTELETTLNFSVIDTGIGIAEEHRERIFEGFSQAEASTTRRFGGTGLGLSICKQLVGLMGGELKLDSVLGQGSTFHFTLTLPNTNHFERELEIGATRLHGPLRVLAVDDNPLACDIMAGMAESWGWQLDKAFSGAEAIALVEQRQANGQPPYEAIFMDWYMPEMDGWQTLSSLKTMLPPQDLPLMLMVTAHGLENLGEISPQNQALLDGFLVKPLTASMLFDAVADARAARANGHLDTGLTQERGDSLKGLRILLVEDNQINQQVAQELLTAEGALVSLAINGQLAVDAVATALQPFDAVLMDIHMPVMDGYAATSLIRQELGKMDLPIIAMTANAMRSDREECLAAGMNDHIGKPFEMSHLIAILQRHTNFNAGSGRSAAVDYLLDPAVMPDENHLNVDDALRRLGGSRDLYSRIMQAYLSEIRSMPDQLSSLLQEGEVSQASRLMHTIKGLSGTVGANRLAGLAAMAEDAFKHAENNARHQNLLVELRREVAATIRIASPLVDKHMATAREPAKLDFKETKGKLEVLHALLQASDMRAMDVYAELRHSLGNTPVSTAELMETMFSAVEAFDFSLAATCCQSILAQLDLGAENVN